MRPSYLTRNHQDMKHNKVRILLILLVTSVMIWIIKATFSQPSTADLKAGIVERAKYRNENNTGPIQHVYVVSVKDSIWNEFEIYGNYKPHHKGGTTKVYFFMEKSDIPTKLYAGKVNFDPEFNDSCIAMYEKTAVGNVMLTKNPFN